MKTLLGRGLVWVPLVALCFTPVWGSAAGRSDAKALFEARCSLCHDISRPLSKSKSGDAWRQTVTRMKGYAAERISDAEAKTIIEYLTEIRGK